MKKICGIIMVLLCLIGLTGCAATLAIRDKSAIYGMAPIRTAPKIVVGDFTDRRANKEDVGKICMLSLKTKKGINILLTDSIAERLRDNEFNIQKINIPAEEGQIKEALHENNGIIYLTGSLTNFSVDSFDAIMEKAKGRSSFKVKIYNRAGVLQFEKKYRGNSENWIGLTGASGSAKSVEQTLVSSVDALFNDKEFSSVLEELKSVHREFIERQMEKEAQ